MKKILVFLLFIISAVYEAEAQVKEVDADDLEDIFDYYDCPIVVYIYADWCGYCRKQAPIVERMAREFSGRVVFCKVNIDRNKELIEELNLRGVPTTVIIQNSDGDVWIQQGPWPVTDFRRAINNALEQYY